MITLAGAAQISRAKINTLRPEFSPRVFNWYQKCCEAGIIPYVYEGFRTKARQDELYAKGRTTPGPIVTHAMAGQSLHQYKIAFDWVPLKRVIKADSMYECDWDANEVYRTGAEIGKTFNLRALSWENPHLEDNYYKDWRDARDQLGDEEV